MYLYVPLFTLFFPRIKKSSIFRWKIMFLKYQIARNLLFRLIYLMCSTVRLNVHFIPTSVTSSTKEYSFKKFRRKIFRKVTKYGRLFYSMKTPTGIFSYNYGLKDDNQRIVPDKILVMILKFQSKTLF